MACPTLKIELKRGFAIEGNAPTTYYSSIRLFVIDGNSTTPVSATVEFDYGPRIVTLSNGVNALTEAFINFDETDTILYDANTAIFHILINDKCHYGYNINLADGFIPANCIQTETTEECTAEYIIDGSLAVVYGCSNPLADNYDPDVTIDDGSCVYTNALEGCTNPESLNYNPLAAVDDGSCIPKISGCTDPLSSNYNALANFDDGSCVYIEPEIILGCTNPLSSNYNPLANFNDGSCLFLSGCTNSIADNYNPLAGIDDGSCECNKLDLKFKFGDTEDYYFTNTGDTIGCEYYLQYDYKLLIECDKLIQYYESETTKTVFGILSDLKFNTVLTTKDETKQTKILEYNPKKTDSSYYLEFTGTTECINVLNILLSEELGVDCFENIESKFNNEWRTTTIKIPNEFLNTIINLGVVLEGIQFGSTLLLNNLKVFKICSKQEIECIVIPYNFGFTVEEQIDNKKAHYNKDEKLVLNTKHIDLKVDIPYYLKNDLLSFFKQNYKLLHKLFKDVDFKKFINVNTIYSDSIYFYYEHLYHLYLNSLDYCSVKSKGIDYVVYFDILTKIDTDWLEFVEQFIPSTTVWKKSTNYYANFAVHQPKHKYKTYVTFFGDNHTINANCVKFIDKNCKTSETYGKSKYETKVLELSEECYDKLKIDHINMKTTTTGVGKLLQYDKTTLLYNQRFDYETETTQICI